MTTKTLACGCVYQLQDSQQDLLGEPQLKACCLAHRGVCVELLEQLHDLRQALVHIEALLRHPTPKADTSWENVDKAWNIAHQYGKRI